MREECIDAIMHREQIVGLDVWSGIFGSSFKSSCQVKRDDNLVTSHKFLVNRHQAITKQPTILALQLS